MKDKVELGFQGLGSAYRAPFRSLCQDGAPWPGEELHCPPPGLLMHMTLTCALPSISPCLGARGGDALNNVKFLCQQLCRRNSQLSTSSSGHLAWFLEMGSWSIQGSLVLIFWPPRGSGLSSSTLRVSYPSGVFIQFCCTLEHA